MKNSLAHGVCLASLALATLIAGASPVIAQQNPAVERQVARVRAGAHAGPFAPDWPSLGGYRVPDWFRDAKFGIFLHWGVYSVPAYANEWYSRNMYEQSNPAYKHHVETYGAPSKFGYKDFIPQFKAEKFDPDAWVSLFAEAGARYVVPVAEHCDGFAMYDSGMSEWTAAKMGPKRDVVGDLAAATRKRGLRFGVSSHRAEHFWWYGGGQKFDSDVKDPKYAGLYGPARSMAIAGDDDSKEPNPSHLEQWLAPDRTFLNDWLARSSELVDKYHPDFMYFDWWIGQPAFQPYLKQFAAYYYNKAEARTQDVVLTYKQEDFPPNAAVLDVERGKLDGIRLLAWQTDTSVSVHSWGYAAHDEYRSAESLIHELVDVVSKNGNLLLNVGPKADGTLPDEARAVLLDMGKWLKVNGEAIYGTRPWYVFGEGPTKVANQEMHSDRQNFTSNDLRYTQHGKNLYAIALGWPQGGDLRLHTLWKDNPYLAGPVCSVELLGSAEKIAFHQTEDGLHIALPAQKPDEPAYTFRIKVKKTICGDVLQAQ